MTQTETSAMAAATVDEIQQGWHELKSRVNQLEIEKTALEEENKAMRFLLEKVIEHRQRSHGELILLLTGLVSKLPINDIGVVVARLMQHNSNVSEVCTALAKGTPEASLPQPAILKAMEQTKRELAAAVKPLVDELNQQDAPLEPELLQSLVTKPDSFFSPAVTRANRCFIKGQVPRERIIREFGEEALGFFNDMTTDRKLNPNPKPEEILLGFKPDFTSLLEQNSAFKGDKRKALQSLHQKIQASKASTDQARAQKTAFLKLSYALELLHYYNNQSTEAPEGVFAQRLPALVEQMVVGGQQEVLDEKLIVQAESLLAFVISFDHRLMVINNIGKSGVTAKTLRYILRLRAEKSAESDVVRNEIVPEFVKHLLTSLPEKPPPKTLAAILRLLNPDLQRMMAYAVMDSDRMRKDEAKALGKAAGKELGLTGMDTTITTKADTIPPEIERRMAWDKIKDILANRTDPGVVANAIRERLHAKYDADEMKQSWITLTEADPISFIRVFCLLPYLADGRTDPVARAVMETYVSRLMHEKYAAAYAKILKSLQNMFKANPTSPTLLNFVALIKWLDPEAAARISGDVGMPPA